MKKRVHIFISGTVQGVFFRSETRHKANKNGLTGWVRNLPEDRVEAVFEGEEENIKKTPRILQTRAIWSARNSNRHRLGKLHGTV